MGKKRRIPILSGNRAENRRESTDIAPHQSKNALDRPEDLQDVRIDAFRPVPSRRGGGELAGVDTLAKNGLEPWCDVLPSERLFASLC